jgi:serine/threonine protein kinase
MTPARWQEIQQLYDAVLACAPEHRSRLLANADPDLRRQVESLLARENATASIKLPAGRTGGDPNAPQIGPGMRLGPYELQVLLGEGAMGQVFRARDTRLGRLIAIKVVRPERIESGELLVRFEREARATAALNHPHICTLFDVGEYEGAPYLVMEFLEGQTLASRLREGPLAIDKLLRYGSQISQALAAAHERGIMHRDLKPANLMVTPSGIKVLDFGLAKFARTEAASLAGGTASQTIVGTPAYMSPEQARGEEVDPRSDLFSLGCVLYEASTGVRPFRGSSVPDVLREVVSGHPAPASSLRPELPAGWDSLLYRALAKDPNRRYQAAAELLQSIEDLHTVPQLRRRTQEREPDPVFGREGELQRLESLLTSAVAGAGRVALLTGEPGIGKTALTRAFAYSARKRNPDVLLARGVCLEQYGTGEAYLVFLDALSSLLNGPSRELVTATLRRFAPTWCLQFPAVFSTHAMEQLQRDATGATKDRMLRELGDALGEMTAEVPVMLILEDLHWADSASVGMLGHLAERAAALRLLIVGTARLEDVERGNAPLRNCWAELRTRALCDEIALAALRGEHVTAWLDAHFTPHQFPPEFAALIHRRSEGHPLFVTGAMQLLIERGAMVRDNGAWRLTQPVAEIALEVPGSIRSLIDKKLTLLDERQRQALLYASIEGEEFTSSVLAALLDADELELEEQLHTIQQLHGLVQADGEQELPDGSLATRYRFTHALYQNHLYDQLLSKRRALLHRRAGETLERIYTGHHAQVAAALATHFERGRDFSKAVTYLTQAADNAVARYANAEAVNYFSRGLELIEKLPEDSKPEQRVVLLSKRAMALVTLRRFSEARGDYTAMRDISRAAGNQYDECRALIGLTVLATDMRDLATMETCGKEAMVLAERIGDPALAAEAGISWALFMQVQGRSTEAATYFDKAIPLARSLGHRRALARGLTYRGLVLFWTSEYEAAEAVQSEAARLAAEVRDGFHLPLSLYYLGLTRANRGKISDAMSAMQEALDFARRNNHGVALTRTPNGLGWLWREIGDLRKAIELNGSNVEFARQVGGVEGESNSLINLVYDYILAGEFGKAGEALEAVEPLYQREEWNRWRFYGIRHHAAAAELWLSRGNLDRAEEKARALVGNSINHGVSKYLAIARRLLGEIAAAKADHNTAEEELMRSLEVFVNHPMPLIEWRSHAALARLLASRNRPAAAREAYRRAGTLVRSLAAAIHDPASRHVFLQTEAVREVLAGAGENETDSTTLHG